MLELSILHSPPRVSSGFHAHAANVEDDAQPPGGHQAAETSPHKQSRHAIRIMNHESV